MLGITFDSLVQGDATAVLPIDGCTNWAEVVGSNPGASNCAGLSFLCFYILGSAGPSSGIYDSQGTNFCVFCNSSHCI